MRTVKNSVIIALVTILSACNNGDTVPKAEYDDVLAEYEELRQTTSATQKAYVKQAEQVDSILVALSKISGKAAAIRLDVETGTGKLTQVEQIQGNIENIKDRIDELEKLASNNAALKKIITGLKKVVEEKDKEISQLKKQVKEQKKKIQEQDRTIAEQTGTINTQYETILQQKQSLEQAVKKQAVMLYNAGVAFENLGDDSPEIKRKKDREKVDNLTKEMYQNALQYYNEAYAAGYTAAQTRITAVTRKINLL